MWTKEKQKRHKRNSIFKLRVKVTRIRYTCLFKKNSVLHNDKKEKVRIVSHYLGVFRMAVLVPCGEVMRTGKTTPSFPVPSSPHGGCGRVTTVFIPRPSWVNRSREAAIWRPPEGLPWGASGCDSGDVGSVPGYRTKIPHASGQLNPSAPTGKPLSGNDSPAQLKTKGNNKQKIAEACDDMVQPCSAGINQQEIEPRFHSCACIDQVSGIEYSL